jgi:DUF4097 and DUF4098 domain-containing protein YvlB
MTTFPTPEPIELRVQVGRGDVTIVAEARDDTTVEVVPSDPRDSSDVEHAEATRIDHHDGVVVVAAPDDSRTWRIRRSPSISVRVRLPEDSRVRVVTESAEVRCSGRLGRTDVTTASGTVEVEHAAELSIGTGSGDIDVGRSTGDATLATASGDVVIADVGGDLQVTSASGDASIGHAHGDLRVQTASGDTTAGAVDGSVTVKTASGDARVDALARGIVEGTTAWLDVQSASGDVRSTLDDADAPTDGADTVRVRVRTASGDVTITRAAVEGSWT